jgi:single-stranded-DNA-specific exonuclease
VRTRWRVPEINEGLAADLASTLGLRRLTARVLLGRGVAEASIASRFLAPRLADMRLPDGIADLDRAVDRVAGAVLRGERVGVFGDYDVDGVTTAALLTQALRALGGQVIVRVASRFAGYGLSADEAARFADEGCTLLLTGDCGTSDHEALGLCRSRGVDVVVIDHHQVPSLPTAAYALINPHRQDDFFSFKGLASCGVGFYMAARLRSHLRGREHAPALGFDPRVLLDLVALGTIADLVPLREENRILVAAGLRELGTRRRPGLRALAEIAALDPSGPIDATDVSFRLTPRLNAPGRLGEARQALELLLAGDEGEAKRRAQEIDDINRERQRIQEQVWLEACRAAEDQSDAAAIVVGQEGWHPGVVGIVAAKLVERFRRPAVVVGLRGGTGRGSARTTGGFDLYAAISACRAHLAACGGHAGAAGLTVEAARVAAFREAFVAQAERHFRDRVAAPALEVDAEAELGDLDLAQTEELQRLAPFGNANGQPLMAVPGVVVRATRVVGNGHLQMTLSRGEVVADAIGFGMAADNPGEGTALDLIASPEVDSFRGSRRTRLRIRHMLRTES